jgi:hypothetical protein
MDQGQVVPQMSTESYRFNEAIQPNERLLCEDMRIEDMVRLEDLRERMDAGEAASCHCDFFNHPNLQETASCRTVQMYAAPRSTPSNGVSAGRHTCTSLNVFYSVEYHKCTVVQLRSSLFGDIVYSSLRDEWISYDAFDFYVI